MSTTHSVTISAVCAALVSATALSFSANAAPLAPSSSAPRGTFVDYRNDEHRDFRRDERHDQRDLKASMDRLHRSITHMNRVLQRTGPQQYARLKDEIQNFNTQVSAFQNLVDHHERTSVLRDAFTQVEQSAAAIDTHIRQMNAAPRVNAAWQDVGAAYHRVSNDIDYSTASER